MELIYSLLATFFVSAVSLVAVVLLIVKISSKSFIITGLISFAAGSLIGDVFFHLLPEKIEINGGELNAETGIMIISGILLMLIVEAILHCSHDSNEELEHHQKENKNIAKLNIIGDAIHNTLDGIAIGASFLVSPAAGIASTLAVILHEIPQELADVSVLIYSGWQRKKILIINFLTALAAMGGALLVFIFYSLVDNVEQILVPIAIGQFLYIALADLVPVIHKKSGIKKYFLEVTMFILGCFTMFLLTFTEKG